uniref:RBR-type E3 ubiquitin transferase n=1 Tax=Timema tahoe TaxID=61484 RepID=A0A7R9IL57_9NEOP|nr:unnamed protein product [Timema tahoe]
MTKPCPKCRTPTERDGGHTYMNFPGAPEDYVTALTPWYWSSRNSIRNYSGHIRNHVTVPTNETMDPNADAHILCKTRAVLIFGHVTALIQSQEVHVASVARTDREEIISISPALLQKNRSAHA